MAMVLSVAEEMRSKPTGGPFSCVTPAGSTAASTGAVVGAFLIDPKMTGFV